MEIEATGRARTKRSRKKKLANGQVDALSLMRCAKRTKQQKGKAMRPQTIKNCFVYAGIAVFCLAFWAGVLYLVLFR